MPWIDKRLEAKLGPIQAVLNALLAAQGQGATATGASSSSTTRSQEQVVRQPEDSLTLHAPDEDSLFDSPPRRTSK